MNLSFNRPVDVPRKYVLWAAIAIPVVMVAAIALALYLPRTWAKPQYDFIYEVRSFYPEQYQVINGKIVAGTIPTPPDAPPGTVATPKGNFPPPVLYYHSTAQNRDTELTLAQAQQYTLMPLEISPDGFHVEHGQGGGPWIFGGPSYNDIYLIGHGLQQHLNLADSTNFNFLGWVKK